MPTDSQVGADSNLPRGVVLLENGRYRARRVSRGKREQKTFLSLSEATKWQTRQRSSAERGLPRGISHDKGRFRARAMRNGKEVAKAFGSVEEAVAWRKAAMDAMAAGLPVPASDALAPLPPPADKPHLFGQALEEWNRFYVRERKSQGRLLPRTVGIHRDHMDEFILPRLGHIPLEELSRESVQAFRYYWAGLESDGETPRTDPATGEVVEGYSNQTVGRLLWMVFATMEYANHQGWVTGNPASGPNGGPLGPVRPPNPCRPSRESIYLEPDAALSVASLLHEAFRIPFWLGRLCGLRGAEAYGLAISDLNLTDRVLHVTKQGGKNFTAWDDDGNAVTVKTINRTKTPAGKRIVGIPELLVPILEDYLATYRAEAMPDEPLITNPRGGWTASSFGTALTAASKELGVTSSKGDTLVPHDLRKSFSTDLELLGVSPFLRSVVMGHKVNTSIEGGAVVTSTVYTLRSPHVRRVIEVADQLNGWVVEHLGQDNIRIEDSLIDNWMRIEEAGVVLGVGADTIRAYCRAGELPFKKHRHPNQNTPSLWVGRVAVQEMAEAKANRTTIADACADLGLSDAQVVRIANENGIPITRERIKSQRAYFDPEGYKRLKEVAGVRDDFLERNMVLQAAAATLKVKPSTVRGMVSRGILDEVFPPIPGIVRGGPAAPRWITRESVEQALRTPHRWRKGPGSRRVYGVNKAKVDNPDYMTAAEAAVLLGRSSDWVRRLAKDGTLEAVQGHQGKKVLVTKASVEAYAKANKVQFRKVRRAE